MKKLCTLFCFMALPCLLLAQKPVAHLWGSVTRDSLLQEPHATWFKKNYDDYKPNADIVAQLKRLPTKDLHIKIFFGSWCGDTKREMPRLLKVLDDIGFPSAHIHFIAVSSDDAVYKQSKNREERGYNVFRVGCYVIEKNGREVNRIIEYPAYSMERDLLTIFTGQNYTPQYAAYSTITQWLKNGDLLDDNTSPASLATQIKTQVSSMSDLNACGYVLLADGKLKEAVKIFRINANLFPDNANTYHSLAEGWLTLGDKDKALAVLEYGLQINKSPDMVKEYLALHKKIVSGEAVKSH
ncbi:MAG: hypothetical protein JNL70_15140 [Saprospiraceae bacterium]|nr:hypothetical protein [Saprospiraceae bacterium]